MSARYRIATIIAPAGFGKSVAVRQFLDTVSSSVVYDVPSDATSLVPFVRGFADALATTVPALRRSLATALDGARDSETPGRDLAAWAATHIRTLDTLIVIDDLHVGENDPEVSRFVTTLVDRTKDGPRWLFSSRSPLQLPVASWLAYGESDLVIDAVDLRFSLDEAKQSARATRVAVRDDELSAILDLVEGWPAALTFALRTSMRASDLRAVSAGTREMVYRYLAEQVWNSLDGRIREFLRTAAFLPRLETRLAVAAGFDDAASIIEALRERVAFITILDSGVYRLHELFRDFIQRQLELEGDDELRAARINAARVLESLDMPGLALERYLDARAADEVVRVLSGTNFALLESGHYDVVSRALRAIPSGPALTQPRILALRAALEEAHGRSDQAERWYAAVLEAPIDDVSFHISVAWRYALMLYQQGRLEALPMLRKLLERSDLGDADRAQIAGTLAMTLALGGDIDGAQARIEEAFALAEFADEELRARTYGRAATVAFFAADETAVERYTREGTRLATDCGAYSLAARLFSALIALHGSKGRIPSTAWYAAQVTANAEKGGDPHMRAVGLRVQLECETLRGNDERIDQLEREHERVNYRGSTGVAPLISARALSALWNGRPREARAALSTVEDRALLEHERLQRFALTALAAAASGDRDDALQALARYGELADADRGAGLYDRDRAFAERYAILANLVAGRNVMAQRALRAAHRLDDDFASIDAALTAVLNRTPDLFEESLRQLRLASLGGVARLLDVLARPLLLVEEAPAGPALTAAEAQVLVAIANGLSNQAIADEQRRTVNTVRTHVSSILRKLGCESRGEAVAAARRLQLI